MDQDFVKESICSNKNLNSIIDFIVEMDKIIKKCGIANLCNANYQQNKPSLEVFIWLFTSFIGVRYIVIVSVRSVYVFYSITVDVSGF